MKALITKIVLGKETQTKKGTPMWIFKAYYNEKEAQFFVFKKDEKPFIEGEENEFTETEKDWNGNKQYTIKPIKKYNGGYNKSVKREQSKYSGFSTSYVKDLIVNGVIIHENTEEMMKDWMEKSEIIFWHMVKLDKTLEND